MNKILVTGSLGQIGSELTMLLRENYGYNNVVCSDIVKKAGLDAVTESGPFEVLDVTNINSFHEVVNKYKIDTVIHLAALLSATGEKNPQKCWEINMGGLYNALEVSREEKIKVFIPSSIAAFGPNTPPDNTPQDTIQRPQSMYGVTKVSGEILCDYYYEKFGVDTRGLRFPGIVSYTTPPGGGTTDYAVDIYYAAVRDKKYSCFIKEGTYMDMMYMPDALNAVIAVMEADPIKLKHRNAFNITAMSFSPEEIANEIKKEIPDFTISYDVDPVRQSIADSWPNSIDDSCARSEWGWNPKYDLSSMTKDMIKNIKLK